MKKILVVRFKQIGDSVLASPICESLKKTYPNSSIDYVIYEHIAPLFENHPAIDNVISITKEEQKNPFKYFKKVWDVTRKKYDIIIDIMSTPKSELFTLLGRSAEYRIGRWKPKRGYTYTHSIKEPRESKDKVDKFLKMLEPIPNVKLDSRYRVNILPKEKLEMKKKMEKNGVKFNKPIFIFAVNSRRPHKVWDIDNMKEVIKHVIDKHHGQVLFFYSPSEKEFALETYNSFSEEYKKNIITSIETATVRELAMLISNCNMFIGNEGGPRHIAQALGVPAFAVFSPAAEKKEWLANAEDKFRGLEPRDVGGNDFIDIKPIHVKEVVSDMVTKYVSVS